MTPVKILLVDDDEDDFIITKDILRESINSQDYELSWCSSFSEAINAMLKSHYDIYLVDYRLGRESGIALLNEAIKSNCTEPIIILTGKGDYKIDQEAMQLGAADYLIKDTLNSETLERAIRYSIAHNKTLQKLKTSENKFRILFERSKDPMLISNSAGQIIDANLAATNYFETTLPELKKVNAASLYKKREDRLEYITAMNANGSISDFEANLLTLKGTVRFCSISSFLQVSQHANEELFYSIIHDLSFRLNQEKNSDLPEKLASNERIAKSLSHEIQNPLSNVNLAIDELYNTTTNEENLILLDIIKANCEKINNLTTELLESTKTSQLNLVDTDLYPLFIELIEEVNQELDLKISNPLSASLIVKADGKNLKLAFYNIIKNSAEAFVKENSSLKIVVDKRINGVTIDIIDSGVGISNENIDKIFEPFFTTKPKAIGLGLTHAQRIINAHYGKIQAISTLDHGTKVSIFLPIQ